MEFRDVTWRKGVFHIIIDDVSQVWIDAPALAAALEFSQTYPLQNYSRSPFNFQYAPSRASSTTSITGDSSVSLLASSQA